MVRYSLLFSGSGPSVRQVYLGTKRPRRSLTKWRPLTVLTGHAVDTGEAVAVNLEHRVVRRSAIP